MSSDVIEPLPPNDRSVLIGWLRRLASLVFRLAKRIDGIEEKLKRMEEN